ncbi:hypothetical protein BO221_20705 [Archangium sp. Cb G35]|uniref:hypothetical protein n=1 Tax=Archangium sp. Cb G35 TaxID=1920190 RepID=UPI0009359C24|nr:hypothetical protein [Archangium sp. Cb G35]OJT23286.1 hypothetical protein BO221_20705 [Archangium sp. Cb G35]
MAEMIGGDIGTQILNAVQGLGVRMDRLETQVADLNSRMARQEKLTENLGIELGRQRVELESLRAESDRRWAESDRRWAESDRQWAEFRTWRDGMNREFQQLRGEVQELRGEVKQMRGDFKQMLADMQEGFSRLHARDELTAGTVVMMASVLRRPTDLGEELEKRLRELQPH